MTTPSEPPPPIRPPRDATGLPTVVAAVVLLLAFPAAIVALLPVPDTSSVEAHLRMDPYIRRLTTRNFLTQLDESESRELSAALDDDRALVRAAALRALSELARLPQDVLLDKLADADDSVRLAALEILGSRYSYLPPEAVPAVRDIALDRKASEAIRMRAFSTLSQAEPGEVDAKPLVDIVVDPTEPVNLRWWAAAAVREPADTDVERLRKALGSKNMHLRRHASQALVASSGPTASDAHLDALGEAASSGDFSVYCAAAQALAGVGTRGRRVAPVLRDAAVKNKVNSHGTFQLLVALQAIGLRKDELTPAFVKLGQHRDNRVSTLARSITQNAR